MPVHLFALDYRRLPPGLRDRVVVPEARTSVLLGRIGGDEPGDEAALLLTCHRCELYALTSDPEGMASRLRDALEQERPGAGGFDLGWRRASGEEAVLHLCRVACGLDSAVIGEAQILGQVRRAWAEALASGSAGGTLDRLFRLGLAAGKRARSAAGEDQGPASVAEVALRLAEPHVGGWRGRRALVIGSGAMGSLLARFLAAAGVSRLVIAARRPDRAASQGPAAETAPLARVPEILAGMDAVVSATSAPGFVLEVAAVRAAMTQRSAPLVLVDVAIPRDIHPEVREIPGVRLIDADEIITRAPHLTRHAPGEVARMETLAAQAAEAFQRWERRRTVVPSIVRLRQRAEDIQREELARALRRLPDLTERELAVVRALAHTIVNRLLHDPTVRLQEAAERGNGAALRQALEVLFRLDQEPE